MTIQHIEGYNEYTDLDHLFELKPDEYTFTDQNISPNRVEILSNGTGSQGVNKSLSVPHSSTFLNRDILKFEVPESTIGFTSPYVDGYIYISFDFLLYLDYSSLLFGSNSDPIYTIQTNSTSLILVGELDASLDLQIGIDNTAIFHSIGGNANFKYLPVREFRLFTHFGVGSDIYSSILMRPNAWYSIEIKVDTANNLVYLYIDGELGATASIGVGASNTFDIIGIYQTLDANVEDITNAHIRIDNLCYYDSAGSFNTTLLGAIEVVNLRLIESKSVFGQWTDSIGSTTPSDLITSLNNYDVTYVKSLIYDNVFYCGYEQMQATTVYAISDYTILQLGTSGTGIIHPIYNISVSTEGEPITINNSAETYNYNLNNSNVEHPTWAWTATTANNFKFGFKDKTEA